MRVSLIKNKKIQSILLPEKIEGSYWISDTDTFGIKRNLISIEASDGKWKLVSNKEVYSIHNGARVPFVYLVNGSFYYIKSDVEKTPFLLYCSPVLTQYNNYEIDAYLENGLLIGSSPKALINYKFIDSEAAMIKKIDHKVFVVDNNSKYGVYVNDVRVAGQKELKIGDVVFILGIKMIYMISKNESGQDRAYLCISDLGNNGKIALTPSMILPVSCKTFTENDEEVEYPLYDEKEYFHKTPRFVSDIKPLIVQVDAPPMKQEDEENSLLLTIGPMLTMSMTSLVTGYTAINNVLSGGTTWERAAPSLVICAAMFASVFLWPVFSRRYEKKRREKKEALRQQKYSDYIEGKRKMIIDAKHEQTNILINHYISVRECADIILNRYTTLWQRRKEDDDYLKVNLGMGSYPMQVDIKYPEEHFSMSEDNLKEMVSKLGNEPKMLVDVPVLFSFIKNNISGLIGDEEIIGEYMRRILIQILTHHSYEDVKIVVLTDDEKEYQWKFLKAVPHCFTNDRSLRFFATNNDEYKEVCYYLDKIFNQRKEKVGGGDTKATEFDETYIIVTDSLKKVRNFDIIKDILEEKKNYGFSLCVLDKKITNLPDQCDAFVVVQRDKGELHDNQHYNEPLTFTIDTSYSIDYEECAQKLANIPIEMDNDEEGQLPNRLGFLEMYDVGKIEQLNSLTRWEKSNPMLNLQVEVGVGKNGEKISIDLHEKYHGPHGLVAGMTGSGKSEFIITYILSMAINYHPYEVQFILIDYKGGGLAGAFENKVTGVKLPHLVGTITNLDVNEIKRSLASIESELKRRQALFNKAREISGESTIDIYKYQKMYRDKLVDEPVSHLFIISDEFAELKNQQPEFMDQLISTARIGRSLGVHLILATQKPSGVVDPQIWSNTRFRVCMRVQDKSDSNEVIKCPDAAYLKQTGRFYFQVGYNEVFLLGQAAYAGGKYYPSEKVNKTIDTSICFINNIGYVMKEQKTKEKMGVQTQAKGEELSNLVRYLDSLAKSQNIKCRPLWLDKIPEDIRVDTLKEKYHYQPESFIINPIIGEYDVPAKQQQYLLTLPISHEGNVILYGASGSGKENFITTLLYSSMIEYRPEEVNYYIIDFGSEALKVFRDSPLVGDVLAVDDEDKLKNLYKMLATTIETRKELFREYNGDFLTYCKNSGKTVPNIVVIINNFEAYQETYADFDDTLIGLSRECNKYGIYFIITVNTPNGVRFKLKQNFGLTYVLQQNSEDDYTTILGNVHKMYPAKLFGRGIIKMDDVYEFQTALVCERDNVSSFIKEKCQEYGVKYATRAKRIPILPQVVHYEDIPMEDMPADELIIGLDKADLNGVSFPFHKNFASVITSLDLNRSEQLVNVLVRQIIMKKMSSLIVLNAEEYSIDGEGRDQFQYVSEQFNEAFQSLHTFLTKQHQIYTEHNYDKKIFDGKKPITCMVIGVDAFKNRLNDENKLKFGDLFTKGKDLGIIDFILVDSVDKIKKIELDSWYKACVDNTTGIWIGSGINNQFSLKMNQKIDEMKREDIPDDFCFVIKRGKVMYVKYIEK